MKKIVREFLNFCSNVYLLYCFLLIMAFSCEVLIKVPLVGVPLLIISLVIQIIEKSKKRD